jgi:hypothetical protein
MTYFVFHKTAISLKEKTKMKRNGTIWRNWRKRPDQVMYPRIKNYSNFPRPTVVYLFGLLSIVSCNKSNCFTRLSISDNFHELNLPSRMSVSVSVSMSVSTSVSMSCPFPCLCSMSVFHVRVQCPCSMSVFHVCVPCPCSMSVFHVCVPCPCPWKWTAVWTWTCSVDMDMQQGQWVRTTRTCSMVVDMDMQHGHRHVAWTRTCGMDMKMQHVHR